MPKIPAVPGPGLKRSSFDEKAKAEMVLNALIEAAAHSSETTLDLAKTTQNGLDKLYRHEIISALESIVRMHGNIFYIERSNYPRRLVLNSDTPGEPRYVNIRVQETQPITLTLADRFRNWREAYLHRTRLRLDTLKPSALVRVYRTIMAIDDRFQLRSSPVVTIGWNPNSDDENATAREDALIFLKNKNVLKMFHFEYSPLGEGSCIDLEINVKEFEQIRDEAVRLFKEREQAQQPDPASSPIPVQQPVAQDNKPFGHLKWEDISLQFLDGHNVRISGKNTKVTAHFKEMGFEDGRNRNPNRQWELLKLLAESDGEFSWDNPKASDSAKKKKQLLSKALREYFAIKGDPFYPYKEGQSYRIRITITPESP